MAKLGDEVIDVFVGEEIIFHMNDPKAKLDKKVLKETFKKHKVKAKATPKKSKKHILT